MLNDFLILMKQELMITIVIFILLFLKLGNKVIKNETMINFVNVLLFINLASGFFMQQGFVVALLLLLLTVWMTNLYNFMDGSNGLAGGMAWFGFAAYGIAALIAHADTLAMLNFSISAAALGFLFFNFHPARVFMGDAGSIPLGFLAAAMGLWGWQQDCWAAWFPLLVPPRSRPSVHASIRRTGARRVVLTMPTPKTQQYARDLGIPLQPIDEDVTDEDIQSLADDIGGTVSVNRTVSIWRDDDYRHVLVEVEP